MQYEKGVEALNSISRELSQLRTSETQGFIHRVNKPLRSTNSKAYEPDIVAIGPYHHDKDECKMMEEHKLRYLQLLLERKEESTAERYISAITELEQEARNCYAEPINIGQDKFIKMLVLDGCFIIELLRKEEYSTGRDDPISQRKWLFNCLKRDLTLIENQIPFFVLCKLFDLIEEPKPNEHNALIDLSINYLVPGLQSPNKSKLHDVKHLLDLLYKLCIPESVDGALSLDIDHPPPPVTRESVFIHSASKLKDANVKFMLRTSYDSVFDVIFKNGTLLMPHLIIDYTTECYFRNLIAYEQYFPCIRASYVTDYVVLLNLLINSSKDVDILSERGIITNCLGDNEVAANMVNKLPLDMFASSGIHVYAKTFADINTHYNRRRNRWIAVLNREYFSNPWAYISVIAAVVLLLLTIVQAVCSVLQVV